MNVAGSACVAGCGGDGGAGPRALSVAIVTENASMRMGGEASLGLIYFERMRHRGVRARLVTHERVRAELTARLDPAALADVHFVPDSRLQSTLSRVGRRLPARIRELLLDQVIHWSTQRRARRVVRSWAADGAIDIVFEPSPITPKGLSFMHALGVPVVVGPLCGGVDFPPAFRQFDGYLTRLAVWLGRLGSDLLHRWARGKREAAVVLVAHELTEQALPSGLRGRVVRLVESGIDSQVWNTRRVADRPAGGPVIFAYSGRLADWKGVPYLLQAFERLTQRRSDVQLWIIGGGGDAEAAVQRMAERMGECVRLLGWKTRPEAADLLAHADVFVMPSLRECGGTAILEAMGMGKPVIVTDWAGPGVYVTEQCGIKVKPTSAEAFVNGLTDAMETLAASPELRRRLGEGGLQRVRQADFDWDAKTDRVLAILREVVAARAPAAR